ncbi:MAG: glycerate kinase [Gemmatimonadaceae bacterium]
MVGFTGRTLATELYTAAVRGAAAGPVTARAVGELPLDGKQRVWVFAIGKAAQVMATATIGVLQRSLHEIAGGIVVAPEAEPSPHPTLIVMPGDHPVPGKRSFTAAQRLGDLCTGLRPNDAIIILLSGGASSLIAAPARGVTEADLAALYELLLGSGLAIAEMNAVRRRFSRWGGGRLALALAPRAAHCLALSDVVGDDLATIGSGPCVPDPLSARDVARIVDQAGLMRRLPSTIRDFLTGSTRGVIPETLKPNHPAFAHVSARVVANNRAALDGATVRAFELGLPARIVTAPLIGEAAARGEELARSLLALREMTPRGERRCLVWGGETTVKLGRPLVALGARRAAGASGPNGALAVAHDEHPLGGRCQEFALAAARVLGAAGDHAVGITLLAAGTDGRDGPTDAAGAVVDATTWAAVRAAGLNPDDALATHSSYAALDAANALIKPGPTGTNVMDIVIGLVE